MTDLVFERERNLTLDYHNVYCKGKKAPPEKDHRWAEKAIAPDGGRFAIEPWDVMRIKYQPPRPEGFEEGMEMYREIKRLESAKEYTQDERHVQRLRAAWSGPYSEQGFAESAEEARMLCSALQRGSEGLAPHDEALTAAGFELESRTPPFVTRPLEYDVWKLRIKSGSFDLIIRDPEWPDQQYGSIICHYSGGGPRWHNVFAMHADQRGQSHNEMRLYHFYPEQAGDLRRIAADHLIRVIGLRQPREKTRLSTPLGGNLPNAYK